MSVFAIIVITLFSVWLLNTAVFIIFDQNEDVGCIISMGLIYPILLVLLYPYRAMRTYSNYKVFYQKRGISRLQYFFGKRIKRQEEEEFI